MNDDGALVRELRIERATRKLYEQPLRQLMPMHEFSECRRIAERLREVTRSTAIRPSSPGTLTPLHRLQGADARRASSGPPTAALGMWRP